MPHRVLIPIDVPQHGIRKAIINFTPSWFSVNMGTGIMAILFQTIPYSFYGLTTIATIFYITNIVVFLIFLSLTIARYAMYPFMWNHMLRHHPQSLFLGTFPMGLATIINGTVLIAVPTYGNWAVQLAWALWWVDVVLSIGTCFGVVMVMFAMHSVSMERMTAVWLLPIVPCVVAAASGSIVAGVLSTDDAFYTLVISYCLWGVGMCLSFLVMGIYIMRLAIHKLPTGDVIVSAFLPLGPLGQGAFGIVNLAKIGRTVFPAVGFTGVAQVGDIIWVASIVVGLALWGFGLWWLAHAVGSVAYRLYESGGHLKYNIGCWGFIFPLGVYTAATIALGQAIPSAFFDWVAVVFLLALCVLYVYVAAGSMYGFATGQLLVSPCLCEALQSDQRARQLSDEGKARPSPPAPGVGKTAQSTSTATAEGKDVCATDQALSRA